MAGAFENQKTGVRILIGVFIGMIALSMLLYLVPQGVNTTDSASDVVAKVGDESVTLNDVRQQLSEIRQRNQIPPALESLYANQILKQLIFSKEIEYEAKKLGISVSDKERADRIRQYVPAAFNGDTFVGMDAYAREVQQRFQLTVAVFEELVRQGLIEEKFRKLITDGVSVSPEEIQEEFHNQNEKAKLDYVLIRPEDLAAKVAPGAAEIQAYYDQHKASYQIPEKRVVRYALLDVIQLRRNTVISDDELKFAYQQRIQEFQVPNRFHAQHILLLTTGKTDAEVEEIKKKAEDILAQTKKKGANFEALATKFSEDPGSKTKGGDLGWLQQGQTVPEFEKAAFGLNNGDISGLVKTQYGFHIIKMIEKQSAHTQALDEVKEKLRAEMQPQKADKLAAATAEQISTDIRQSNKTTLDGLIQKYHLIAGETRPVAATDAVLELGNSKQVKEEIFQLKQGALSLPVSTDRGYIVLTLKEVLAPHQGSLEEVREKVLSDLKQLQGTTQTQLKAKELESKVKGGEKFEAAAKSLGLDPKTSEPFSRTGSLAGVGSGKQLAAAFTAKPGEVSTPLNLGQNWVVYEVVSRTEADPAEFEKQKKTITDSLLQTKRSLAFDAFRVSLEARMKADGKLKIMNDKMKGFGDLNSPLGFPNQ